MFLGHIAHHVVLDPRDRRTLLLAARTGHLGPTVFRSTDLGRDVEGSDAAAGVREPATRSGASLNAVFWLTPGHASEPGVWYAGGSPQGLFRTDDGGDTWEPVSGWNDHKLWETWAEWPDGGHARRLDAALDHRRPARRRAPLHRPVGRRRVREHRRRRRLAAAQRGLASRRSCPIPSPSSATIRTACACTRCGPTGCTSRTTAASTAWSAPKAAGCASATTCRATSATSASRSSCTRAIPTPRGCSRWTAPTCGRARAPTAGPPRT